MMMGCEQGVLLTGATGALGSWLARAALADGLEVYALTRGAPGTSTSKRVAACLTEIRSERLSGLHTIEGDILLDSLGLSPASVHSRVQMVIHCAARTEFEDNPAGLSRRTNVEGLRHVLAWARKCRAALVHVSTAYVAGDRVGRVYENELDVGQGFNNIYERTKCEGELLARRWGEETGLPVIILRPSIVVGDRQHGRALRFNTVYDMMRVMDTLGPAVRGQELRVAADTAVTKNVIPVDYFAEVAWRLIRHGRPGTYHIVHTRPPTFGDLRRIFAQLFNLDDIVLVSEAEFARKRATAAERICHRAMTQYRAYMVRPEPMFDTSATEAALARNFPEPPVLDVDFFRRLLTYARQADWGRKTIETPAQADRGCPVQEYFQVFLARKLNQNLLPDLRRLSSRFEVRFQESPDWHWSLEVRQGVLTAISQNGMPIECSFTVDLPTFREIVSGRLSPQQAFFRRRVEIGGDMELGLKTAAVLAQFFRRFPFTPGS
jgi:nucleoside-diphosphate-sugar epimerase/predicted lipid carrier protein YhbT